MARKDKLTYDKDDIVSILKTINYVLISLHRIGSCYDEISRSTYERWTTEFIDNNQVTHLLSEARQKLSSQFAGELGDDDKDELERLMDRIEYWQKPEA